MTHIDESVDTKLRETVSSLQRTNFQNRIFELTFPRSQGSKASEGRTWCSLNGNAHNTVKLVLQEMLTFRVLIIVLVQVSVGYRILHIP